MKIGLVDADLMDNGTRHPNLALMKIAGFYKENGHDVELIYNSYEEVKEYEKVFISKVFTFSNVPDWVLNLETVTIGGTGFFEDGGESLPDEIEHHKPYYDLYKDYVDAQIAAGKRKSHFADYLNYSIGFTSRGCFRKCSFCVNKKYDHAFLHSPVAEFLDENRPFLYLWDDNILSLPQWESVLDDIEAAGKPFQFRQGIDLRLMTDKKAMRFTKARYHGDFIFAFDHLSDRDIITEKVQLWKRYTAKVCKMYVLCAYNSQDEKDIYDTFTRIKILMKYGSLPYIMRFESYKTSPYKDMYVQLARWCNQPQFFKKMSFREFCIANQSYKTNKNTNCSAYQALIDFEIAFPEIASEFFDLKFEEENIYQKQYGYGRRYANKPECNWCKTHNQCWEQVINDPDRLLELYFTKQLDLLCLTYNNADCTIDKKHLLKKLVDTILNADTSHIIELIKNCNNLEDVEKDNVPQYSDLSTALYGVTAALRRKNCALTYEELGHELYYGEKKSAADEKYGENHAKLAVQLDLVIIQKHDSSLKVELSELGKYINTIKDDDRDNLLAKLCLRVPIVQKAAIATENREDIIRKEINILSASTRSRRYKNTCDLVEFSLG